MLTYCVSIPYKFSTKLLLLFIRYFMLIDLRLMQFCHIIKYEIFKIYATLCNIVAYENL